MKNAFKSINKIMIPKGGFNAFGFAWYFIGILNLSKTTHLLSTT
jgi:hypothetical protein